jgi:signal recognition particle subunit SRP54
MIPGLPQDLLQGSDEDGALRMKRMIYITDSMSSTELDSDGSLFMEFGKDGKPIGLTWRVSRVARGSGTSVREVEELLCQYRMMANMAKQAGGKNGWLQAMQKIQGAAGGRGRGAGGMPTPAQIQAMQVRPSMLCRVFAKSINSHLLLRTRYHLACFNRCNDK